MDPPATRHEQALIVLRRLLSATRDKQIIWHEEKNPDTWYLAKIRDREQIAVRLLWYESTNQIGADPAMFEFSMPGMNAKFAFGTEGADILFEILGEAFESWKGHNDPIAAIAYLNEALKASN